MCSGVFCRLTFHELIGLADVFIHVSMGKIGAPAEACIPGVFQLRNVLIHLAYVFIHVSNACMCILHILEYAISLESNYWSVYQVQ